MIRKTKKTAIIFLSLAVVSISFYWFYLFLSRVIDPNSYKEEIARQIENSIGYKVFIGGASLKFGKGVGIKLGPVKIYKEKNNDDIFSADSIVVFIKIRPLLSRKIQIRKIILNGPVFFNDFDDSGGEPVSWRKILPIIGETSRFRIKNGLMIIPDNKGKIGWIMKSVAFNLVVLKNHGNKAPYSFEIDAELKYRDKSSGVFILKGNVIHVPEDLDFRKFEFDSKIKGKNIKQEFLAAWEGGFQGLTENPPGSFDIDVFYKGSILGKMESGGTIQFTSGSLTHKENSVKSHSANLDFSASYQDHILSLKELDMSFGNVKIQGSIDVEGTNSDDPLLNLDIGIRPLEISRLKENIFLKTLSEDIRNFFEDRIKTGKVHLSTIRYNGPWSWIEKREFEEIKNRLTLRFSLMDAEGNIGKDKTPVIFSGAKGQFTFDQKGLSFQDVSFDLMGSKIFKLSGKRTNSDTPKFENINLEAELNLEKLETLLKRLKLPYTGKFKKLGGTVFTNIRFSVPVDDLTLIQYSGNAIAKNVSFVNDKFKNPLTGINGKIRFSSHEEVKIETKSAEKAKTGEGKDGMFLRFENITASSSESKLYHLNGTFRREAGTKGSLSLLFKALVDFEDAEDLILLLTKNKARSVRDFKATKGKVELDLKINGEINALKTLGSLRFIHASFKSSSPEILSEKINGRLQLDEKSITAEDVRGKLNGIEFSVSGKLDEYLSSTPEFDLNVYLSGDGDSLKNILLSTAVEKGREFKRKFVFDGPFKIKLKMEGTPDNAKVTSLMDFTETLLQYEESFKKEKGKDCKLSYSGLYRKDVFFAIDRYEFSYMGKRIFGKNSNIDIKKNGYRIHLNTESFPVADLLDLISVPHNPSLTGTLGTDLILLSPKSGELVPYIRGEIKLNKFGYHFEFLPVPIKDTNGSFFLAGEKIAIDSFSIKYKDSEVVLSGTYEGFQNPKYELNLDSQHFHMNDILPTTPITIPKLREFLSSSNRFGNTDGKIIINVRDGDFKFLRWRDLKGVLTVRNKAFYLTDAVASLPDGALHGSGNIDFLSDKGMSFLLNLRVLSARAKQVMYILGPGFDGSLEGDFSLSSSIGGEGYQWDEIRRSLHGKLALLIKNGKYENQKLSRGVENIFGFDSSSGEEEKGEPKEFYRIGGNFRMQKGTAVTDKFVILTKERNTTMVGKILLGENQLDLSVGVAPWAKADKIVSKIPLVGSILTGGSDKSLLISYYKIKGDMANPQVKAMPLKSIGKKFQGIFKGILETPKDIQNLLTPD